MIPCKCPQCPNQDCVTLREVARIGRAPWWMRWLFAKLVRRTVTGYLQQCPLCDSRFIVTDGGVQPLTAQATAPPPSPADDPTRPPAKPRQGPAWPQPPGV